MNKNRKNHGRPQRRFCHATDGPEVRQRYAYMPMADLARELGLTVKQIENYTFRHNSEPWTRKQPSVVSCSNRENGRKGGRPQKKSNKKANTFFVPDILHLFAAETTIRRGGNRQNKNFLKTLPRNSTKYRKGGVLSPRNNAKYRKGGLLLPRNNAKY